LSLGSESTWLQSAAASWRDWSEMNQIRQQNRVVDK
jgi:hypothetical protein